MIDNPVLSTGTALYYPYIHPRSPDHLKAALIYWDRVRRIVPESITHGTEVAGDDEDVRLLVDRGLLIATPPEPYKERAAEKFFRHIEPNAKRFRISVEAGRELARRNVGIHVEKLGNSVITRLHERGVAHRVGE